MCTVLKIENGRSVPLLVTDRMHLTNSGLGQGEGTFAFGVHLLLHHQGRGVMAVVNSVVFCDSSSF